jgi:hypothetical protein
MQCALLGAARPRPTSTSTRDSMSIGTTAKEGAVTDSTGDTDRARYSYQACEAGTSICSDAATVTLAQ